MPVAGPACGCSGVVASRQCWAALNECEGRCTEPVVSDLGLCAAHLWELRGEQATI